jgi:Protein of unknown function (DUF4038)/Bacterial Ig-like domain
MSTPTALAVSTSGRHLVDAAGDPLFIVGDAAWSLMTGLNKSDALAYLDDRAARGFNLIMVNLVEAAFNGPVNQEGQSPFLSPGDFSAPNEAYFQHADWVIKRAAERGMYVLLCPSYLGFYGTAEGWFDEINAAGAATMFNYGQFVGNRYNDDDNLIWMLGGDRNPDEAADEINALAAGIRSVDTRHLMTAHAAPEFSGKDGYPEPWIDLNTTYTYAPSYMRTRVDYLDNPGLPTFLMEDRYEGAPENPTSFELRRSKYWAVTSGGSGALMGNWPMWYFGTGWDNVLNSQLANEMTALRDTFARRDWSTMSPDFTDSLVLEGIGTFLQSDWVTTSISADRRLAISYVPTARTVGVELSNFASNPKLWWVDPHSGDRIPASGTNPIWSQTRTYLATPGLNDAGDGDWLLVLDADLTAPTLASAAVDVERSQALRLNFTEDVGLSFDVSDLELRNLTTNTLIPAGQINLAWDVTSRSARATFNGILPDGDYRLTIPAGAIQDMNANANTASLTMNFHILAGDANRDRQINFADLLIVAQNYGQSNRTFATGDFNYDQKVDFADLLIVAQKYGSSLMQSPTILSRPARKMGRSLESIDA